MNLKSEINRREFLWTIGSLSAMAAIGGAPFLSGIDNRAFAAPKDSVVSVAWLAKDETSYPLFKNMIEKATDFSWLKKGDKVLVKTFNEFR